MVLEYKSQIGLEAIMPVLDEHVVWYGKIVRSYFEGQALNDPPPSVFEDWLEKAKAEKGIQVVTAERITNIHDGMVDAANDFMAKFKTSERPPLSEYNELSRYYEEFIQAMRQIELDQAIENSGYDEKTGLRSVKVMETDIVREMERRARRGNPFSLALLKINNYKEDWRGKKDLCASMVLRISDSIKQSLRSFDDAYYLGDEYFLLSLKHADLMGGQAALARINQFVTAAHIPSPDDPLVEVSVSSVICEPAKGDRLEDLVLNMKKDLEGIDQKGTVLQYNEMSPLQRYLNSMDKK